MEQIVFSLPGNEHLAAAISIKLKAQKGETTIRQFPDGESYVQIISDVKGKDVIVVCTLHLPDDKLLPLYFLCKGLKEFGANTVKLVAPYLAYMRQDKRFNPGEVVTSEHFANLISSFADSLITIDPHLHRRHSMAEIYSIPCKVLHASDLISNWIKKNIENPVLIGPDSESEQWVSEVARNSNAPFIILKKIRRGDEDVEVSVPNVEKYKNNNPVLVDDIISTARTMIATIGHLKKAGMKKPICIGVHGVFANNAYIDLLNAGAEEVITCNTIPHESNKIKIDEIISLALINP
jgi:ribose-phosphate pyrophosphokinase